MAPRSRNARTKAKPSTTKPVEPLPSDELGGGNATTCYNSRTGRPIRRNAGRKSLDTSYVDPEDAISDVDDDFVVFDDDFEDQIRVTKKRKRSPSPPMTPRQLIDDEMDSSELILAQPSFRRPHQSISAAVPPISLTFNVPPGHSGPFVVNLDLNSLLGNPNVLAGPSERRPLSSTSDRLSTDSGFSSQGSEVSEQQTKRRPGPCGFLTLPAELRNEIYRLVLVSATNVDFGAPRNFPRTAAILRTCHQVHDEARSILYSGNVFCFRSNRETRVKRFTSESYQIAYKDAAYFLRTIGSRNIALIRHLIICFEDFIPSLNYHLKTNEDRRFTRDLDLMALLRQLADYGRLKNLDMSFQGRRHFSLTDDERFTSYLTRVRADEIRFISFPPGADYGYKIESKTFPSAERELKDEMQRDAPFYGK